MNRLYDTIGGNPLALKLAIGLLTFLPLERALACLHQPAAGPGEELFTYIYAPLVARLPDHTRQVLEAMTFFAPQGATYEELRRFTGLSPQRLDEALYQLIFHALLDMDTKPPQRYFIHRLTYVYLTHHQGGPSRESG